MALKFAVNNSLSAVTTLPTAIPTGALSLIQTQTASSSATIDFTSGIDDTYDSYVFKFINIHPATDDVDFQFQTSTNSGSSYGVTCTSTAFRSFHNEDDSSASLDYTTGNDLAQSTNFKQIMGGLGADNDQSGSGILHLFNPSSTTFVKHFILRSQKAHRSDRTIDKLHAGYFNTTNAINAVQFKMDSGNIDSGTIKMYGVK